MHAERLTITVVAERGSWQVPYATRLVDALSSRHDARLVSSYQAIEPSELAFFLGCTRIAGPEILARSRHNLVVHQSPLPQGRGWSPLAWQVLEGRNEIPVTLFEAVVGLDEGPIYARETIRLEGHELVSELRELQGASAHRLIVAFVERYPDVEATPQTGEPTYYPRRTPDDMRLDPTARLVDLFPLLRIADNERYPAFFDHLGHRFVLRIEKAQPDE